MKIAKTSSGDIGYMRLAFQGGGGSIEVTRGHQNIAFLTKEFDTVFYEVEKNVFLITQMVGR